jgi:hypothetical protein
LLFGVGGELWDNGELLTTVAGKVCVRMTALILDSPTPFSTPRPVFLSFPTKKGGFLDMAAFLMN